MAARKITARFASTCPSCEDPIEAGSPILYERRRGAVHDNGTCELPEASGPTTRERKLARAERLEGWADGREAKGNATLDRANQLADMIPMGQPILVGHHSERRHRRHLDQIHSGMDRGIGDLRKAESMRSRAAGIVSAADRAIYSDDPDAIEQLEARIAVLEAERDRWKAFNAAVRKAKEVTEDALNLLDGHQRAQYVGSVKYGCPGKYGQAPAYHVSNLTGNIKRNRDRLAQLQRAEVA